MCSKDEFLCVIHDKMDHVKTTFARLQMVSKMICGHGQLPITLIGMIAHGHGYDIYAQYSNELWLNDPNFTIGSLLWLLQTLEKTPTCESKMLCEHAPQKTFFICLLQGKSHYTSELEIVSENASPKLLPKKLLVSNG